MAYYPGGPGYNRPPGFNNAAPGYGPPGMAPPGTAQSTPAAPGVAPPASAAQPSPLGGPRGLPSGWQAPTNMPNFDMNARVIRMGTTGPTRSNPLDNLAGRRDNPASQRRGLGHDTSMRDADNSGGKSAYLVPPTREEIARTIFAGNIPNSVSDDDMGRILSAAGNLRTWTRVTDSHNKPQTFGFAEYEDAASLETAAEIFKDGIVVPLKEPAKTKTEKNKEAVVVKKEEDGHINGEEGGDAMEDVKTEEPETARINVVVDAASIKYAEEWKARRNEDEATIQFRIDTAKETLNAVLASLLHPRSTPQADTSADVPMQDTHMPDSDGADVLTIAIPPVEDELADIPEEIREIVQQEINAFRERANRRDMERAQSEREVEEQERRRNSRANSGARSPVSAPLGPRADRGVQGAPTGPRGSQFPRDYQAGVSFTNGFTLSNGAYIKRDDDDDSASDEELERRRQEKAKAEDEKRFQQKLQEVLRAENRNANAMQRQNKMLQDEEILLQRRRKAEAERLAEFDDEREAKAKRLLYYADPGEYLRERKPKADREEAQDRRDRDLEREEMRAEEAEKAKARSMADSFLEQQAAEMSLSAPAPTQPARFKLSLGNAAKRAAEKDDVNLQSAAAIELLLEDEEDSADAPRVRRPLKPLTFDANTTPANLTEEEVKEYRQQLAREVPTTKEELFKWPISWEHLLDKTIDRDIKKWVEAKLLSYLGVVEDMMVNTILQHVKDHGTPQALIEDLEMALDEEAEGLVMKLWRMLIYYSEVEKRLLK